MQKRDFEKAVEEIRARDKRYHANSYAFVKDALDYTLSQGVGDGEHQQSRHVSGQELLEGFREYSLKEFGPMVPTVFNEWGITCCRDVGEMVFNLIGVGIFGKTESDTLDDFTGTYEFHDAFVAPFLPRSSKLVGQVTQ